jgi:hypothetical protein
MIRHLANASLNSEKILLLYNNVPFWGISCKKITTSNLHVDGGIIAQSIRCCQRAGISKTGLYFTRNNYGRSSSLQWLNPLYSIKSLNQARRMYSPFSNATNFGLNPYHEGFLEGPTMPKEKKKKKKKKAKPKKEIPPMDSIEVCLEKMNIRFNEIEKEHLGPQRGIRTVKWIAGKKCEGMHKTVTTKMANSILNSWIYCRHALQHGFYQLNDMNKKELAESLLGKGTKIKVPDREARLMLKELFRKGKSGQLDRYMLMHEEKMKLMGRTVVAAERNRLGIPKIRSIATVEEMAKNGYTQEEIDAELVSRVKKEENRRLKKIKKEMPAYLRHEVSGARRQEAKKIQRILRRKEKKKLRKQRERELRLGITSSDSTGTPVKGLEDTDDEGDSEDDDSDYDSEDCSDDSDDDDDSSSDDDDSSDDDESSDDDDDQADDNDDNDDGVSESGENITDNEDNQEKDDENTKLMDVPDTGNANGDTKKDENSSHQSNDDVDINHVVNELDSSGKSTK